MSLMESDSGNCATCVQLLKKDYVKYKRILILRHTGLVIFALTALSFLAVEHTELLTGLRA